MPGREPTIVLDHTDFWLVNKPIGWTVQKDAQAPGVLAWLQSTFGQAAYPVHRLDKPTSGLLLVAKTPAANSQLSQAFAQRNVEKTYLAIAAHKPRKKQGWIKGDMAVSRRSQWKLLRSQDNPAVTYFTSVALADGLRGYTLQPKTGKTHQLRVALKSIGTPILGDTLYGGAQAERLYLHAWRLSFEYSGQRFDIQQPPGSQWLSLWPEELLP